MPAQVEEKYEDTPRGQAQRIKVELDASTKSLEKWHERGVKAVKRYRNDRDESDGLKRLNLLHADIDMKEALLYGQVPKVTASRRFADAQDDTARVGSEILERLMNTDIEKGSDSFSSALRNALKDWLLPGGGFVRLRYVVEMEDVPATPAITRQDPTTGEQVEVAPEVPAQRQKKAGSENVHVDYVYWKDVRWGQARVWSEVPWVAFMNEMTREQLVARFGEEIGRRVPLNIRQTVTDDKKAEADPHARAGVWEFWDEERRKVYWFVDGYAETLDEKDDPLGLDSFWPCPEPLFSNLSTDAIIPEPDYGIAKDLYDGCDELYARICLLEESIRVVGAYDKSMSDLGQMLKRTTENKMVAVDNWALLAEKGGLRGVVDWFPLDMVAAAIDKLTQKLSDKISLLQQVTGMAEVMRGASATQSSTATSDAIKAKFGSVRSKKKQDEFARFASDAMRLKAEIIAKHFEPETIATRSNMENTPDAPLVPAAIELVKSKFECYRIEVKPEQVSMQDYASLKQERTEFLQAVSTFFSNMAPMAQALPGSTPLMLQMVQWAMAGFTGASTIEGVLDQAIAQAEQQMQQPKPPPPPDPKVQAAQMKAQSDQVKAQADLQKVQMESQADLTRIAAETQAAVATQAAQATWNVKEEQAKAQIKQSMDPLAGLPGIPGGNS